MYRMLGLNDQACASLEEAVIDTPLTKYRVYCLGELATVYRHMTRLEDCRKASEDQYNTAKILNLDNFACRAIGILGMVNYQLFQRKLAAGYRRIDTAPVYMNEEAIGKAIRASSVPREQIHVTNKISTGFKRNPSSVIEVKEWTRRSLTRLGLDYLDTILIHHPGEDAAGLDAADRRRTTWQGLEAMVKEGSVRSIGVSNFHVSHLRAMKQYARVLPVVNQIEVLVLLGMTSPLTDHMRSSCTHGANRGSWLTIAGRRTYHYKHILQLPEIAVQATKGLWHWRTSTTCLQP
jgi:diketogulonate reductase-like aldo/keto reductase